MIVQGDGVLGRFAVWTGTDDEPWSNPTAHFDRIKIHSDLDNAGIVETRTGTLPNVALSEQQTILFAHGLDYIPHIRGYLTINGNTVPINQGVLVPIGTGGIISVTFGVNATNVVMNILNLVTGVGVTAPTITYVIYIFDVGVNSNGTFRRPAKFPGIDFDQVSGISVGYISSSRRYFYKTPTGPLPLPNGRTISSGIGGRVGANTVGFGVRQSINGHVVQRNVTGFGIFAGNNATFNADVTKVDI